MPRINYKKTLENILLTLVVILIFITVFEIILRLHYSWTNFTILDKIDSHASISQNMSHGQININGKEYNLNSQGLWDKEYDREKENITRIVTVGDSFTFGVGLENRNLSYPNILESELGEKYEVINFAFPGFNSLDIFWVMQNRVLEYNPDIVIYGYFYNDVDFTQQTIDPGYCGIFRKNPYYPYTLDFFNTRKFNLLEKERIQKLITEQQFAHLYQEGYYGWNCVQNIAEEMYAVSDQNNISLFVFFIPSYTRRSNESLMVEKKVLDSFPEHSRVAMYNFSKQFWEKTRDYDDLELRVDPPVDYHYNEKGHKIIAEILYDYVTNET